MRRSEENTSGRLLSASKPVTVGLAIQCRHYREALAGALSAPEFAVADPGDGPLASAPTRLLAALPKVVLIDFPIGDTVRLLQELRRGAADLRTIAVNRSGDEGEAVTLFEAGLFSYLDRCCSVEDVRAAIREAVAGQVQCPQRIVGALVRRLSEVGKHRTSRAGGAAVSPREDQVLNLLALGLTNKEIAQRLSVEVTTAKNHVHSILRKFGVHQRGEAVRLYRGW